MTDYAMGGLVHGPRDPADDTIDVVLTNSCRFITSAQVAKYPTVLDAINQPPTGGDESVVG